MDQIKVFAVVGPTASGKSALALALAKHWDGEIISCDSMQVYRRMNIGTAKPNLEEQSAVPHHLIDVVELTEPFSVADYVELATQAIDACARRGKTPILCGGTGLYLDALLRGGVHEAVSDEGVREELYAFYEANGAEALHRRLQQVDPAAAEAIHPNNVRRVVRALEIYATTGKSKTEQDRMACMGESPFGVTVMGLLYRDRTRLYRRIEERVDQMLAEGLVEETRMLMAEGVFECNATAAQAIGYKELFGYLRGEESLAAAADRLKTATRRYAKRQMTWFSAKDYVHWLEVDPDGRLLPLSEWISAAEELAFRS
ncbi:MAG: tRNA (adenosine(37)-N6)-dimethylallyltransferase MiaA [Clostridia bacterium]|nr:tRNA (adenosine(37)-N6)-dimethylallyltransferase MiaA [Clostridia bacterium]